MPIDRSAPAAAVLILALPLCVLGPSCSNLAQSCGPAGVACGGDATGNWNIAGGCREAIYAAPVQMTYVGQPAQVARQPVPSSTSGDWCASIIFGAQGAITNFVFPHDTLSIAGGHFAYNGDGTYDVEIDTTGSGNVDLSANCLTRSGLALNCDMVASSLAAYAAAAPPDPGIPCSDSPGEPSSCRFYDSYQGLRCAGNALGGCSCSYTVDYAGKFKGHWEAHGGTVTHFDVSSLLPAQVDSCVQDSGNHLTLSGHDGTSILGETGVMSLSLEKAP